MHMRIGRRMKRCLRPAPYRGFALAIGLAVAVSSAWGDEQWLAPPQARSRRNPLPASAAGAGTSLFATYCASCHGAAGRGDGLAAAALNPLPRDLTSRAIQREPDGALFWKITKGRGAMPAWPWLAERERWALVWAIRELGRTASGFTPPAARNPSER